MFKNCFAKGRNDNTGANGIFLRDPLHRGWSILKNGSMFEVEYDEHANCLKIIVKCFWKPETVAAFAETVGTKARAARVGRPNFDVLVESLEFPVQANDVADLLADVMRMGMIQTTGRAAVVVGSQLNKLQAERTLVHPRVRIFLDVQDATNWLAA